MWGMQQERQNIKLKLNRSEEKAFLNGASDSKPVITSAATTKVAKGRPLRQIIAAFVANLGTINTGLVFGFSAVVIPMLRSDKEIQINKSHESWVASLSSAATPFGCILGGYLMDNIGRKLTLLLTEIPLIIGWLTLAGAQNVAMIYIGRMLVGFGSGMVGAPARVYTGEVTQPHLRGMLGALASISVSYGVLQQYVVGAYLSWKWLSAISALVPTISLLTMLLMPESPNYLLTKNEVGKARISLAKLRGSTFNLDSEIDQMVAFKQKHNVQKLEGAKETIRALLHPSCLKPFGILTMYFMLYQFSGVNTITFYAVDIFTASTDALDKNNATILLGVVRFLFTIVGCIASRRFGRRPITFFSATGCGVSMFVLGSYMYYKESCQAAVPQITPQAQWVPIASILIYTVACTAGFLIVPWVMIGEVYPTQVRGIVGGMTTCMAHFFVFVTVKTYPMLKEHIHDSGAFWLYSAMSGLAVLFLYFYLPETKGRSLQEIEDYFCGRTTTLSAPPKETKTPIPNV